MQWFPHTLPVLWFVAALPFGTEDLALTSIRASCFWLKLPKGVGLEIKHSYHQHPAFGIWGAADLMKSNSKQVATHRVVYNKTQYKG